MVKAMLRNLDTDLLRAFVTVAETNSFTKASERLFRTQAAISMQVKRLEERIGKPIFVRSRRGLTLTSEGDFLMAYAQRILHLNDEVFANLSLPRLDGIVRIGTPDDYATILMPDVLSMFAKAFPEVQVDVACDNGVNLIREVQAGRLDLGLITQQVGAKEGEVIREEQLHWITSVGKSPHTLDPLPLALFPNGCVCRDIALRTLKDTDRSWKIVFASSTIAAILAAVTAGVAVSVMEESVIPDGARKLGEAEGFPKLSKVEIALYRAPGRPSRPAVVLADHIRLCLKEPLPESTAQPPQRPRSARERGQRPAAHPQGSR
jgi:DNA-binding transcriptional LysR family regulator